MRDSVRAMGMVLGVLACVPASAFLPGLVPSFSPLRVSVAGQFCSNSPLCSTRTASSRLPEGMASAVLRHSSSGRKTIRLQPLHMQAGGGEGNLVDGEKYTEKALAIMQKLTGTADRFKQQFIEAELLLYATLQDETVQKIILKAAGKGVFSSIMQQLVQDVEKFINTQPQVSGGQGQKVMGSSLRDALQDAMSMQVSLEQLHAQSHMRTHAHVRLISMRMNICKNMYTVCVNAPV